MRDLEHLIEPLSRGDPESALRWTCKSVRKLAQELDRRGHRVSHRLVAELLHELGYSLQANVKTLEGSSHPDRNAQFEHIHRKVRRFLSQGQPVISVESTSRPGSGTSRGTLSATILTSKIRLAESNHLTAQCSIVFKDLLRSYILFQEIAEIGQLGIELSLSAFSHSVESGSRP